MGIIIVSFVQLMGSAVRRAGGPACVTTSEPWLLGFGCPCSCLLDAESLVGRRPRPGQWAGGAQVCRPGPRLGLACSVDSRWKDRRQRERRERIGTPSGNIWGLGGGGSCTCRGFSEIRAVSSTLCLNHSNPYTAPGADAVTITLLTGGRGGAEA